MLSEKGGDCIRNDNKYFLSWLVMNWRKNMNFWSLNEIFKLFCKF